MITKERALELIEWEIHSYEIARPLNDVQQEMLELWEMAKEAIKNV